MKYRKIVILTGLVLSLVACKQSTDENIYYEVQKKLSTIESYQCTARIQVIDQEREVEYVFKQSFKAPNKYRLEVLAPEGLKGNLTVYNGKTGWLQHPSINQTFKIDGFEQSQEQFMFIGYFLENYITSKESEFQLESLESRDCIVMETTIPGGNHYFDYQRLWVDKKHKVPVKLYIYDEKDNIRFRVYYEDFIYNPELEDNLFYLTDDKY